MFVSLLLLLLCLSETVNRESLRFVYSTEQGYDTSCGLTTLSCFLDKYWEVPADELSLTEELLVNKIEEGDFTISFADMMAILKAKGFSYKAYKLTFEQLEKTLVKYAPIIVHYDRPEGHFVLALAVRDGMVLTADPAEGTILRERSYFESRWSGMVLVATLPNRKVNSTLLMSAVSSVLGRKNLLERAALVGSGATQW